MRRIAPGELLDLGVVEKGNLDRGAGFRNILQI